MMIWVLALPVLVAAFAATRQLLRRRGRTAVRILVGLNAFVFVVALAALALIATAGTGAADVTTTVAQARRVRVLVVGGAARRCHRRGGLFPRGRLRGGLHRCRRAGGDE